MRESNPLSLSASTVFKTVRHHCQLPSFVNLWRLVARFLYRFRLRSAATIIHLSYQPGENYLSYHALFGIAASVESCASSAPLTRTLARPAASTALLLLQTGTSSDISPRLSSFPKTKFASLLFGAHLHLTTQSLGSTFVARWSHDLHVRFPAGPESSSRIEYL